MAELLHSGSIVLGASAPIETVDHGIRRQILAYGPDLMTCRVWFEAGAVGAVHTHPHSQCTYVESGRFLAQVGEEYREVCAGDSIYIAPHQVHGSKCLEAGVMLDSFSPMRADFLAPESAA